MKIAIGSDHGGFELKDILIKYLENKGHELKDYGTYTKESTDYPDHALKVAKAVVKEEAELGILICGTGVGVSLSANKVKGIRAAAVSEPYSAKMSRAHNNANIVCIGERVIGDEVAKMIVDQFIETEFEGGRHSRRVQKIMEIEKEFLS